MKILFQFVNPVFQVEHLRFVGVEGIGHVFPIRQRQLDELGVYELFLEVNGKGWAQPAWGIRLTCIPWAFQHRNSKPALIGPQGNPA